MDGHAGRHHGHETGPYYSGSRVMWEDQYPPLESPYAPADAGIYRPEQAVEADYYGQSSFAGGPIVHEGFVPQSDAPSDGAEDDDESLSMLPESVRARFGGVPLPTHLDAEATGSEGNASDDADSDEDAFFERAIAAVDDASMDPDYAASSGGSDTQNAFLSGEEGISEDDAPATRRSQRGRGRGRGRGRPPSRGRGRGRMRVTRDGDDEVAPRGKRPLGRGRGRRKRRNQAGGAEFQRLQNLATDAYLNQRLDEALEHAQQAVQANPNIFASHSLLSEVLLAMGRKEDSLNALLSGAHTKRDPKLWWHVADRTFELDGDRQTILGQAYYCYSQAIRLNKEYADARAERLKIQIELEQFTKARREAEILLKDRPDDMDLLRQFAELCAATGEVGKALEIYEQAIDRFVEDSMPGDSQFDWSFLNVYLDLLDQLGRHDEGVQKTRTLSRWLLGRDSDRYWDAVVTDCEWDFDDEPRRIQIKQFIPGQYQKGQYGEGMPLEIRIKLGLFRAGQFRTSQDPALLEEAYRHFDQLNPRQGPPTASLAEYDDLWREVGDSLYDAGEYAEAFRYYEGLQKLDIKDPDFILALATCHAALGNQTEALKILEAAAAEHRGSIPIHLKLARLYEASGRKREAVELAHKVTRLRARQRTTMPGYIINDRTRPSETGEIHTDARKRPRVSHLKEAPLNRQQLLEQGQVRYMAMREAFEQLVACQDDMEQDDQAATEEWMRLAEQLIDDFRSMSCFYPAREKWRFAGYRMTWATEAEVRVVLDEQGHDADDLPTSLHDIPFDDWVDLFCRCALTHAKRGHKAKCEEIIRAAMDANICYQEPGRLHRLHACYLACGIALSDEEIIYTASRYFFKAYPFVDDSYRIFNASTRLYDGTRSWYNSGPSQKVILRAIKEMDYALMNPREREAYEFSAVERNVYTKSGTDMEANPHELTEMSPALLTTYAHVLAAGGAYPSALNYYFRAWTLQPEDPSLNLSIANAYIQHGMKRQSENRQFLVQQGLAFLLRYRRARGSPDAPAIHAQEAEFNVGRMMSLLGLQYLAIECFQRCLELSAQVQAEAEMREASGAEILTCEDFAPQAAFSLQNIAAIAGDVDEARRITRDWLVI